MKSLSMVLIAVLWLSLPAVGADAPAAKDAQGLADEVKQAATPLGCSYFADLPDRIWADTKVRVVGREEARSMIASEYGDHFKDYKSAILTLGVPAELSAEENWGPLYLVGFVPAQCNPRQAYVDWLYVNDAAVYDWNSKTLLVVKDEQMADLPTLSRRRVIVQELSNALVQRHIFGGKSFRDIDMGAEQQQDNHFAIMAVIEGSARLLANRYQAEFTRTNKGLRSAVLQHADYEQMRVNEFMKLPLYVQSSLGAAVCGMHFLMRGKPASASAEGKTVEETLQLLRTRRPETTEEILHPEMFFNKDAAGLPILIDAPSVERHLVMFLVKGWTPVGAYKDTFGELLCSLLAKPKNAKAGPLDALNPSFFINEAGSGWGGDKFFLLRKGAVIAPKAGGPPPSVDQVKGVWVTVWDTPKDREEFVAAYSKNMPKETGVVLVGARTAVFLFNMTPQERDGLARLVKDGPPTLQQGYKPVNP